MITFEKMIDKVKIFCDVMPMGEDLSVLVYGGDRAHIGSCVLSIPRPSLTGKGTSVTTSVLNCLGHKDEVLARLFAEKISVLSEHTTVCICGVHVDGLEPDGLKILYHGCEELLEDVLLTIKKQKAMT